MKQPVMTRVSQMCCPQRAVCRRLDNSCRNESVINEREKYIAYQENAGMESFIIWNIKTLSPPFI